MHHDLSLTSFQFLPFFVCPLSVFQTCIHSVTHSVDHILHSFIPSDPLAIVFWLHVTVILPVHTIHTAFLRGIHSLSLHTDIILVLSLGPFNCHRLLYTRFPVSEIR
ncbi:hypothetical protein F4860DRAFT_381822 [Xylaria cubensis]|nr:hypothetical protein F4860DRAFT_381822 [Xylaria cubensis]